MKSKRFGKPPIILDSKWHYLKWEQTELVIFYLLIHFLFFLTFFSPLSPPGDLWFLQTTSHLFISCGLSSHSTNCHRKCTDQKEVECKHHRALNSVQAEQRHGGGVDKLTLRHCVISWDQPEDADSSIYISKPLTVAPASQTWGCLLIEDSKQGGGSIKYHTDTKPNWPGWVWSQESCEAQWVSGLQRSGSSLIYHMVLPAERKGAFGGCLYNLNY